MTVPVNAAGGGIFRGPSDPNPTTFAPDEMNAFIPGGGVAKASTGVALRIDVSARKHIYDGTVQAWNALSNQLLTDNTTTYVYLDLAGYGGSQDPTISTSFPGSSTQAFILAEVTTSGGAVTEIAHRQERWPGAPFSGEVFTTADETKLDGIEELADVTDATNVAAAGAVMDSDFANSYAGHMVRTGAGAYKVIKHKLDATAAPTVDNDTDEDYEVGSLWIDVTSDAVYQCVDATDGAAVWKDLSGSGGSTDVDDFTHDDIDAFDANLVHCWPMTETSGTTLADSVGSSDLSVNGSGWTVGVEGPAGRAITGDKGLRSVRNDTAATTNYLDSSSAPSDFADDDFSISMWILIEESDTAGFMSLSDPTDNTFLMLSQKTTSPSVGVQASGQSDGGRRRTVYGKFIHVVVTRDKSSGDVDIYLDAVKKQTHSAYDTNDHSGRYFVVGRNSLSSDNAAVRGCYGEICIWDTIIDSACVQAIFNNGKGRFHG